MPFGNAIPLQNATLVTSSVATRAHSTFGAGQQSTSLSSHDIIVSITLLSQYYNSYYICLHISIFNSNRQSNTILIVGATLQNVPFSFSIFFSIDVVYSAFLRYS